MLYYTSGNDTIANYHRKLESDYLQHHQTDVTTRTDLTDVTNDVAISGEV